MKHLETSTKFREKYLILVMLRNTLILMQTEKKPNLVKQSKLITKQPKPTENSHIINLKSATIEHPGNTYNLSKSLR